MFKRIAIITIAGILLTPLAHAKIDLVTLPVRDKVQLTIYNAADITLVREQRTLTLKKGINRLEFSWADTLIDPTSVHLEAPKHSGQVNLLEVAYPPKIAGSAIWTIESQVEGEVPVEITFFTSGISWRAFYMGTLATNEQTMRLQGYVRVDNHSGEDYANAQTRVVVGKIHLLDQIAELARRNPPFGMPLGFAVGGAKLAFAEERQEMEKDEMADNKVRSAMRKAAPAPAMIAAKEVVKEGLSEYFLYTIEGTETIPTGWAKRLLSLEAADIPVRALYRYDEQRYSNTTRQFLFFKNDKAHKLGDTPLPDGNVTVYRELAENKHLTYVGAMYTKYIPVEQEVELELGTARDVKIEPVLMDFKTTNYLFDHKGNVSGFDRMQQWQLKIENNRDLPTDLEIFRHFEHSSWNLQNPKDLPGQYEKVDVNTIKYRLTLPAHTTYNLNYTLTLFEGERQTKH